MKILVFSDSHGNTSLMRDAITDNPSCEMIIHLGDCIGDIQKVAADFPNIPYISVQGNCDVYREVAPFQEDLKFIDFIDKFGVKIMCMHGHSYDVKVSLEAAINKADDNNAALLLYGHTHIAENKLVTTRTGRALRLFNPGSIGSGFPPSYGIIEIEENGNIKASHVKLN